MHRPRPRWLSALLPLALLFYAVAAPSARADDPVAGLVARKPPAGRIEFVQETLDNGLQVLYAPMRNAPVVHVRVLYKVGSRDERPDRQGFAHMFEHMMFRGSAHVKPEEHMKLIGMVGGNSNAFTSFDQTVYVNTLPSNNVEMALYLEADRMASFKVSAEVYRTERKVVGEEWGRQQNSPYGPVYQEFLRTAFTTHSYRWTPIGNMDHLRAAPVEDLQEFFNTYYVPNNATLVVAGDIDVEKTRAMVRKYYAWIPKGPDVVRHIPAEPRQAEARSVEVPRAVPLPMVLVGYHIPPYRSDDTYALGLLGDILSHGAASRLSKLLVSGENPMCTQAGGGPMSLEDVGMFNVNAMVMAGKDPQKVIELLKGVMADVAEKGVTEEELSEAKVRARVGTIRGRQTAEQIASDLGQEALFGGDPDRANTELAKVNAVTVADVQRVAKTYLAPEKSTTLLVKPDLAAAMKAAASQPTAATPVVPSTRPVAPRAVTFPDGYPATPPLNREAIKPSFAKGTEIDVAGVRVIVMPDARLPLVSVALTTRAGSDAEAPGQEGLGSLTASMMERGGGGIAYLEFSKDLAARGINADVSDGGDYSRLSVSTPAEQLDYALTRARQMLLEPNFEAKEFAKLKEQSLSTLMRSRDEPEQAAEYELNEALYGNTRHGRHVRPENLAKLTLDDVKAYYKRAYVPNDAILVITGDVTVARGQEVAKKLLDGWPKGELAKASYDYPPAPTTRRVILIDRPEGRQSMIRMRGPGYTVHDDDKFAGSVGGQVLSSGIDSRLGRYVRAEKGYVYSVWGYFRPFRHHGFFNAGAETSFPTTADTVEAMFKVFGDMRAADITPEELTETKLRVSGAMVMQMQTMQQQAQYRTDGILNGFPVDYYDTYPQRINDVTGERVRQVANKYIRDDRMAVVVVAPAAAVRDQLGRLGSVEVLPMPARREGAMPNPNSPEMLRTKPTSRPAQP